MRPSRRWGDGYCIAANEELARLERDRGLCRLHPPAALRPRTVPCSTADDAREATARESLLEAQEEKCNDLQMQRRKKLNRWEVHLFSILQIQ